jgi:lysophospholipase L1-like esterase
MADRSRPLASQVLLWGAIAIFVAVGARAAWRLHESAELVRLSRPLQRSPVQPSLRLLIVGDSTAVGTGATTPQASVAGLLGRQFPHLHIDNRARDGAKFADLLGQLDSDERFDMVLVMAGGNDVVRLRGLAALQSDIERVLHRARQRADLVVLMPAGNVGNAPFFFRPVSWLMTWRSRRLHALASEAALHHGAVFVNLFREAADDPFVQQPGLNAKDGLHPSDAGYRVWFDELMTQAALSERFSAAHVAEQQIRWPLPATMGPFAPVLSATLRGSAMTEETASVHWQSPGKKGLGFQIDKIEAAAK